jgi:starch-binding outer membrane protein SusE/F
MKNIKIISSLFLLAVLFTTACKKKVADRTILTGNEKASVLTVTAADSILLMMDKADMQAIAMKWTATDWGFTPNSTKYDVQIVKTGMPWSGAKSITVGGLQMAALAQTELNDIAIAQGIAAGEMGSITSRVRCYLPDTRLELFTNEKSTIVKTYTQVRPTITTVPPADTIVLKKDSAAMTAVSMSWNAVNWNTPSTSVYELQIKEKGESWDNALIVPTAANTSFSIGHKALNVLLLGTFGVDTLGTASFVFRVKASQPGTARVAYSDEVTKSFTTYQMVFETNKMYVPGDYQGWNPAGAQILEEVTVGSGNFSGIIEKTKADGTLSNGKFKITPAPNWDYDFGDNGSNYSDLKMGSGIIGPKFNGTNNTEFLLADGTYKIMIDTTSSVRTWSYSLENWGLIGDATNQADTNANNTPDGWENDKNMRYNQSTKMYEITTDLLVGAVKFRKNDAWAVDYGDNGNNLSMDLGGSNIPIAVAGNYTIKMDLESKVYTITKN